MLTKAGAAAIGVPPEVNVTLLVGGDPALVVLIVAVRSTFEPSPTVVALALRPVAVAACVTVRVDVVDVLGAKLGSPE